MIRTYRSGTERIAEFVPSLVPSSLEHEFGRSVERIQSFGELKEFLTQATSVLVVISKADYELFKVDQPRTPSFVWHASLIWRRKFPHMRREILTAVMTLDFRRLEERFRTPMLLISNRPREH